METKANTALIGAFSLIVLALGFVFVYWLARGGEQSTSAPLTVIFEDPVTGLAVGSQVVFNGINIGTVKSLTLDPARPKSVRAVVNIQPLALVKQDTQVTLGFQGLTGVGYIEMAGGSPDLPPIWQAMPEPTIVAVRSSFQDLMAGARGILSRTDSTLKTVETLVTENADDVAQSIRDVQSFTGALAQNSDKIANLVDQVATASAGIAESTERLRGIVERSDALISAVDPEQVRSTLDNIAATTQTVSEQAGRLGAIVDRADAVSADIQAFSGNLPELGRKTDALLAAVDPEKVSGTLDRLDAIAAAVDPAAIRSTVDGLGGIGEIFQANRENINTIVTKLTSLSGDLSAFASRLPVLGERTDSLLAAIDGERLGRTLENVDQFAATLAGNSDNINAIVADARQVASRFESLSTRAESVLAEIEGMTGAGGPGGAAGGIMTDARETLASIRDAADSFNAQIGAIGGSIGEFSDRGLRDLQNLVSDGQRTISRLDRVITDVENDPTGFVFGGERVPEFRGQQRR
jgi:phospholipid/cholesterol/gamma-HCH transport system substrate-binding protein